MTNFLIQAKSILRSKLRPRVHLGLKSLLKPSHFDEVDLVYKVLSEEIQSKVMIDVGAHYGESLHYFINDQKSLEDSTKIAIMNGCSRFCIWHLFGGNPYYSDEFIEDHSYTSDNVIDPDYTEVSEDYTETEQENENSEEEEFSVVISSSNKKQMYDIMELLNKICQDSINLKIKF